MRFAVDPFVIAHRGASAYAPENTVAAFSELAHHNAGWIEFDVFLSKDNIPMVFHDDSLQRITGKKGRIHDFTCDALQLMDAGSWYNKKFIGEKIPKLETVLTTLTSFAQGINVEVKSVAASDAPKTAEHILRLINQHFSTLPIWYSSFDEACLQALHAINPDCFLGWLTHRWRSAWPKEMARLHCQSIHINHSVLSEKRVKAMSQEFPVFAYTVNNRDRALQLFDWGVRAVYSDYPDLLSKAL